MKKSTIKRMNARTTTETTTSNLNRIMGKRDARRVVNFTKDDEADELKAIVRKVKAEFKVQFEGRSFINVNAKEVRKIISNYTMDDIESAKSCTGSIDVRKLVSKAVAKAAKNAEKAAKSALMKAAKDEAAKIIKAAKDAQKAIDKAAEKAEKAASC